MATELGQAYVQIMPSAKGIKGSIEKELGGEATSAGKSAGSKIAGAIKGVIATAAIGKTIGTALTEGGDLQQSLGGIETLFKDNADKVKKYADEAYKTTGLSANSYMENVTSFSASLLQSLGGDTEKAAEKSNMAMIDMADNSNKMGTSMESIQNAYQGFSKQNYTMLDNLKLGYGGTKSEMERLLADATKLTGVKYDINNLSDVYEAIHVVQDELDITGTTAKESAETLSGSLASMKGAFKNVIGNLALGEDIKPSLQALTETITTFLFNNLLPMVGNILKGLPDIITTFTGALIENLPMLASTATQLITTLVEGIGQALPVLIPAAVNAIITIVEGLISNLPLLLDAALQLMLGLAEGLITAIPQLIERLPDIISSIIDFFITAIPMIIDAGIQLLTALVTALPEIIDKIVEVLPEIIDNIVTALIDAVPLIIDTGIKLLTSLIQELPLIITTLIGAMPKIVTSVADALIGNIDKIIDAGVQLFIALVENLPKIIVEIVKAVPQIITSLVKAFSQSIPKIAEVGLNLVKGLWNGIKDATGWLLDKIKGFGSTVLDGIKGFFGIHSPSKLFEDEIGKNLALGLGEGFTDNMNKITKDMIGSIPTDFEVAGSYTGKANYGSTGIEGSSDIMDALFSIANRPIVLNINGREFARFTAQDISSELDSLNRMGARRIGVVL
jgi:phage-related protein